MLSASLSVQTVWHLDSSLNGFILSAAYTFWLQEEIFVARAPGRLDVMGGIADYSGSLVLQVRFSVSFPPIACLYRHIVPSFPLNVSFLQSKIFWPFIYLFWLYLLLPVRVLD